jgi:hypothetical protein
VAYDAQRIEALERVIVNAAYQLVQDTSQDDKVKDYAERLNTRVKNYRRIGLEIQAGDGVLTISVKVPD